MDSWNSYLPELVKNVALWGDPDAKRILQRETNQITMSETKIMSHAI